MAMMQLPAFQPPQFEQPLNMMVKAAQLQALQDASEEKQYAIAQRAALQDWRGGLNRLVQQSKGEITPEILQHFVQSPDPTMQKFGLEQLSELGAKSAFQRIMSPPQPQPQPSFNPPAPTENLIGTNGPNFLGADQNFSRQQLTLGQEPNAFRPVDVNDQVSLLIDKRDKYLAYAQTFPNTTVGKNAMEMAKLLNAEITNLRTTNRPQVVAPGARLTTQRGEVISETPPLPVAPTVAFQPGSGTTPGQVAIVRPTRGEGLSKVDFVPMPTGVGARVPVTPTVTTVEDPKNPGRGLVVDAETYRGGSLGDAGVIGLAPESVGAKKLTAAQIKAEEERAAALSAFEGELGNTLYHYRELDRLRAIPSTERGSLENLSASMGASGIGQTFGRSFGTEAQASRDAISGSRLRLLNAVAKILGVKSGQLNSNVELQTYLRSLSDPTQSIQAVEENIANLEAFIQRNLAKAPEQPAQPVAPARTMQPKTAPKATGGGVDKNNPWLK